MPAPLHSWCWLLVVQCWRPRWRTDMAPVSLAALARCGRWWWRAATFLPGCRSARPSFRARSRYAESLPGSFHLVLSPPPSRLSAVNRRQSSRLAPTSWPPNCGCRALTAPAAIRSSRAVVVRSRSLSAAAGRYSQAVRREGSRVDVVVITEPRGPGPGHTYVAASGVRLLALTQQDPAGPGPALGLVGHPGAHPRPSARADRGGELRPRGATAAAAGRLASAPARLSRPKPPPRTPAPPYHRRPRR